MTAAIKERQLSILGPARRCVLRIEHMQPFGAAGATFEVAPSHRAPASDLRIVAANLSQRLMGLNFRHRPDHPFALYAFRHDVFSRHQIRIEPRHGTLGQVHAVLHREPQRIVLSLARSRQRHIESPCGLRCAVLPVQRDVGCPSARRRLCVRFEREPSVVSLVLFSHE